MADAEPQDAYIYFTPVGYIEGESKDDKLSGKSAVELTEFTIKGENSTNIGSSTGGGGGAGKVKFDRLTIKKYSDKASTGFFKSLAEGKHYDEATIELRRNGMTYLKFMFKLCLISEVELSQSGDDEAEDSITIDYGAIRIEYTEQGFDGSESTAMEAEYSRVNNKPEYTADM